MVSGPIDCLDLEKLLGLNELHGSNVQMSAMLLPFQHRRVRVERDAVRLVLCCPGHLNSTSYLIKKRRGGNDSHIKPPTWVDLADSIWEKLRISDDFEVLKPPGHGIFAHKNGQYLIGAKLLFV